MANIVVLVLATGVIWVIIMFLLDLEPSEYGVIPNGLDDLKQSLPAVTPVKSGCMYCGRAIPLGSKGDCPGCGAPLQDQVETREPQSTGRNLRQGEREELLDAGWSLLEGDSRILAAHHPDRGLVRFAVDDPRVVQGVDLGGYKRMASGGVCWRSPDNQTYCLNGSDYDDPRRRRPARR